MRTATYLMGAALVAAVAMIGAVVVQRSTADTSAPAGQEGPTVTSPRDPAPKSEPEPELEDDYDYDLSLEDPVIEDGEPATWEEFARDAAAGQHPDDVPVSGGGAITVTEGEGEPPR
ncbi:hypothetical protein [Rhodococcus artemisiae]|uniref:Secreted protein n=1 Tax=Rhodococcus artemisiae TaxID=714159 RepID=A0ABU7LL72_9NOCA|nr:hypothetical protein [Rhodococcus artemisiae]MEE2062280.1 hypothetical protein [Rhodococcus artemisiae]